MCASSLPVPSPPLCHHLSRVHLCSCSSSLRGREPVSAPWIQSLPCTSSLLPKTGLPSSFQLGSAIGENRQEMTEEAGEVGCLYSAPSPQVGCDFLPKAASPLHTATLSMSGDSSLSGPLGYADFCCQHQVPAPPSAALFTPSTQLCKLSLFETPPFPIWVSCLSRTLTCKRVTSSEG